MRCILAVSGTLQEGFPLRKNLDAPGAPAYGAQLTIG